MQNLRLHTQSQILKNIPFLSIIFSIFIWVSCNSNDSAPPAYDIAATDSDTTEVSVSETYEAEDSENDSEEELAEDTNLIPDTPDEPDVEEETDFSEPEEDLIEDTQEPDEPDIESDPAFDQNPDLPEGWECDPVVQDCPPEFQCSVRDGLPKCVIPNENPVGEDEACYGGQCEAGLICVNFTSGTTCTSLCYRETGVGCPESKYCGANLSSNADIGLCVPRPILCDIHNDTCPEGRQCGLARDPETGDPILSCVSAGDQPPGGACGSNIGRCSPYTICIQDTEDGTGHCYAVCQEDSDCTEPETCRATAQTWGVSYCR